MLSAAEKNDRTWATLVHLSPLLGYLVPVPGATILAPLVVWLAKRHDSAFLDDQGKEALNFNLTFAAAAFSVFLFGFAFVYVAMASAMGRDSTHVAAGSVFFLVVVSALIALALAGGHLILMIVAAVKANDGAAYRYPLSIRFVR